MPLFKPDDTTGDLTMSHDVWKYFAVALPLTVVTLGFWRFETCRLRRRRMQRVGRDLLDSQV